MNEQLRRFEIALRSILGQEDIEAAKEIATAALAPALAPRTSKQLFGS